MNETKVNNRQYLHSSDFGKLSSISWTARWFSLNVTKEIEVFANSFDRTICDIFDLNRSWANAQNLVKKMHIRQQLRAAINCGFITFLRDE